MESKPIDLDDLQIAKPCDQSWDDMTGDERARRCAACELDVLNIADMTRDDATELIQSRVGERTCVRLFRRHDGTVLTRDCPVGSRLARAKKNRVVAMSIGAVAITLSAVLTCLWAINRDPKSGTRNAIERAVDKVSHKLGITSLCNCPQYLGYILF